MSKTWFIADTHFCDNHSLYCNVDDLLAAACRLADNMKRLRSERNVIKVLTPEMFVETVSTLLDPKKMKYDIRFVQLQDTKEE